MAALTAFNYAVIQGPAADWLGAIPWLFVGAALLLAGFLWWESRAFEPMMELSLFREPAFSAGNAAMATLLFGMVGSFFLIPLYLQDGLGFSALRTGLALAPIALVLMTVGPIAGSLSDRIDPRLLVGVGMLVVIRRAALGFDRAASPSRLPRCLPRSSCSGSARAWPSRR